MTENKNRCVVTGLGVICAIGNSVPEVWENALAGKSGIDKVKAVSAEGCYADIAAEVSCDELDKLPRADEMDRCSKLCVKAASEAIDDAKLDITKEDAGRISVIMGSCVGGVASVDEYYRNNDSASLIPKMPISAVAPQVAQYCGAKGVVTNIANACAAGTISVGYACDLIREGRSDIVIAGGSDAFASVPFAGFMALSALDAEPCSPFNHCHGITLGEGSGVLIVESYEHAMARGAHIYCEVLGSGVTTDAYHITSPRSDGLCQMEAINRALDHSGLKPSDIGYVNAHGTGTGKNDSAEFLSLRTIFEGQGDEPLSVNSTKTMTGHCLGAAGAIEAVFSVKALTENHIPPGTKYSDEDMAELKEKGGTLDFVPNTSRKKELTHVMSNSFAFGGNDASIIFSKEGGGVKPRLNKDRLVFTGIGFVSPVGNSVEAYKKAIEATNCGVAGTNTADAANAGAASEADSAGTVPSIMTSSVSNEDFAPLGLKMAFYRKLDKFSQLQAVSGMAAIQDAGIEATDENSADIGIIVGTSDGPMTTICNFQQDIIRKGNAAGSAFNFPNTVYNAAGGYLSICSSTMGYNVTLTNGPQSGLQSVAYAMEVLRQDRAKVMLATGNDENSDIMNGFYDKLGVNKPGARKAYTDKDGFRLSDGSTALVIEHETDAKKRGAKIIAEAAGFGMAHCPVSIGHLAGSGEALDESIKLALDDAGITEKDIDGIVGFGCGLSAIDDLEIASYGRIFGDSLKDKPIFAIKDVIGEGRAAAATAQAMHAVLTLSGELGSSQQAYIIGDDEAVKKAIDTSSMKNLLVTSYGAGGSYTALVIRK